MLSYLLRFIILGLIFLPINEALSQNKKDALAPKSSAEDALTGQLYAATIATCDLAQSRLFYEQGFGMQIRGPLTVPRESKRLQRQLWGIPNDIDWDLYILERPETPDVMKIRLLVLNKPTPSIHQSWNSMELGPLSLGFPNTQPKMLDSLQRRLGFGSQAPMQTYPVKAPDGSTYNISETIFNGPDFVKGINVHRGNGMPQLCPVDEQTGLGGPGYSAQVVENSEEVLKFYTEILGLELRADRVWETTGALGAPAGTKYRFALVYAKGASHGHLLFIDYLNAETLSSGVAPRLPNRGLAMWTFPVKDLKTLYERAKTANVAIVQPPTIYESPLLGKREVMTLLAPNGFLVELFQVD